MSSMSSPSLRSVLAAWISAAVMLAWSFLMPAISAASASTRESDSVISRLTWSSSACFSAWRASISPAASSSCAQRARAASQQQAAPTQSDATAVRQLPEWIIDSWIMETRVPAELTKRFVNEPSTIGRIRALDATKSRGNLSNWWIGARSRAVIGVTRKDRGDPVELFGQHHPHQLVRPGEQPEGKHKVGLAAQGRIEPVRVRR